MLEFNVKHKIYILLSTLFCATLLIGNLIFKKFTYFSLLGINFEISVGALTYPITFIFTDLISEFYGKEKSEFTIKCGLITSVFIVSLVSVVNLLPSTTWSPISFNEFDKMFGMFGIAFFASQISNYIAQLIDIKIYIFFKNLTNGKMLWLRNNCSTLVSQVADAAVVYSVMAAFGALPLNKFGTVFSSALLFKMMFTICITPFYYLLVSYLKKLMAKNS